ncbi:high choriolytic enzyme 2-like isoform X1 [Takifugu rubripes]|uniref:high choriolytic enzyme 2-like isoform X1 n=1 Tax=Takifugu rubripes TaxID=31033 RepID=UPI001145F572|nr:high choriolytic enzyme 2-like isoform X1 [Takifugu rubripes]
MTTMVIPFLLLILALTAVPPSAAQDEIEDESSDVTEIIAKVNENIEQGIEHGDVAIPRVRNADPCTARGCKWPKRGRYVYIPIVISSSYSTSQRNIIIRALLTFHQRTCIRFVWRRWWHRNYLYFFSGSGCWSYIGRQRRGQAVSLKAQGCLFTGTVQHEVLHALGFHHEQARSDRDTYITILTQNIQPGAIGNFAKVQTNNLGTPYDYNSVMHYSKYAFSRNGQPTLIAKPNPNQVLGSRAMSTNDVARVNRLYQCCESITY